MVLLITVLIFAAAGAGFGWYQRKDLVKRGAFNEPPRPPDVSREQHARTLSRWRRRKRFLWMVLYALFGGMAALIVVMFIHGAASVMSR
jgi:hypothetical protein